MESYAAASAGVAQSCTLRWNADRQTVCAHCGMKQPENVGLAVWKILCLSMSFYFENVGGDGDRACVSDALMSHGWGGLWPFKWPASLFVVGIVLKHDGITQYCLVRAWLGRGHGLRAWRHDARGGRRRWRLKGEALGGGFLSWG